MGHVCGGRQDTLMTLCPKHYGWGWRLLTLSGECGLASTGRCLPLWGTYPSSQAPGPGLSGTSSIECCLPPGVSSSGVPGITTGWAPLQTPMGLIRTHALEHLQVKESRNPRVRVNTASLEDCVVVVRCRGLRQPDCPACCRVAG